MKKARALSSRPKAGNIKRELFASKCRRAFCNGRNNAPPQARDLAQRLLAYENAAGKTSEPTEFAAFRVCERLRQPVITLAGVAGFRPLLSRALTLAKAEAPSLSAVQISAVTRPTSL